jgi:hypothetical protein
VKWQGNRNRGVLIIEYEVTSEISRENKTGKFTTGIGG